MVSFFIIDPHYMKQKKMKIDYWGLFFLTVGLGCLQIVLDKGQQEDWFASHFITSLAVISALSLILFLIVESFAEHPVVDLKIFKSISFSTGNIVMFLAFFNLFGSIVLLPIYLQNLMGYTATLAGLVLGPGGFATLFAMPIAGKFVNRMNPKIMLAFGIATAAYATYLMAQFNLYADFYTVIWPRVVLGIGMGFIFIPLVTLTMAGVKIEDMANATAIFNLIRNLGGSFGVAFITTMLSRRAQIHQAYLTERLTPFDQSYQFYSSQTAEYLSRQGLDGYSAHYGGLGAIYQQLVRQATMMSFNDVFHLASVLMFATLLLLFLMRRNKTDHT